MNPSINSSKSIGIFDSGVGGLTVVRAVRAALPAEDIVYLGDTARVPYGSKSAETVRRYARGCDDDAIAELWTIPNGGHVPTLSSTFAEQVVDWLLARSR